MKISYLFLLLFLNGCFVEPAPSNISNVTFNLSSWHHKSGISLGVDQLYFEVTIKGDDLEKDISVSWQGNPNLEEATISIELLSGKHRRISLTAFILNEEMVDTYGWYDGDVEFLPGEQTISAALTQPEKWSLNGELLNSDKMPSQIAVMDILSGVLFPPTEIQYDGFGKGTFTIDNIPAGRFFYLIPLSDNGTTEDPFIFCPIFFGESGTVKKTINIDDESC
jgi:hypothetical protein